MTQLRFDLRPHRNEASCPYCHDGIDRGEQVWQCPRCTTAHHSDCARRHGRCTVLACNERWGRSAADRALLHLYALLLIVCVSSAFLAKLFERPAATAAPLAPPAVAPAPPASEPPAPEPPAAPPPRRDELAASRKLGATTTWLGVDHDTSFLVETTAGLGVKRESVTFEGYRGDAVQLSFVTTPLEVRRIEAPLETDQLAGWTVVTPEPDEVLEIPAGVYAARHFSGLEKLEDGSVATVELWLHRHCPVPLRKTSTVGGRTTTSTLVAIQPPR